MNKFKVSVAIALFVLMGSAMAARLPVPGSDDTVWADILNLYLNSSLGINGTFLNVTNAQILGLASCNTIDTTANGTLTCGIDEGGGVTTWLLSPESKYHLNDTTAGASKLNITAPSGKKNIELEGNITIRSGNGRCLTILSDQSKAGFLWSFC